jgi:hypothetical protein
MSAITLVKLRDVEALALASLVLAARNQNCSGWMKSRKKLRKISVILRETPFRRRQNPAKNGTFCPKCGIRLGGFNGGCHHWLTMI